MRRRWTSLPLGVALLAVGCHTYQPIATPTPGTIVRVRVPVTSALADPNAPPQSVAIEGSVLSAGDTLVLATETRRELGAFREIVQFDTLRLAESQRLSVELREFSSGRSIALGVVITAGVVGLAAVAFGVGGGSDGDSPDTNPPNPAIVVSGSIVSAVRSLIGRF